MKKYLLLNIASALALLLLAIPMNLKAQLAYPNQPMPESEQEAITLLPPLTVADVLRTVPGVYVNEPNISIRGNDAPPLFIVDGVWIGNDLNSVTNAIPDVRAIESIEVRKSLATKAVQEALPGIVETLGREAERRHRQPRGQDQGKETRFQRHVSTPPSACPGHPRARSDQPVSPPALSTVTARRFCR